VTRQPPLVGPLLALTVTTGFVDGVSYLGLGHVFTANMTGNVVLLGFGIAGAGGLPVLAPVVSLVAFLAGAGVGGRLAERFGDRHGPHFGAGIGAECALVAAAAVLAALATVRAGGAVADAVIALLALAMGLRNATVRRLGVPDLTTTVLTMTLTGIAADAPGAATARRAGAVAAMFAGAVCGALLVRHAALAVPLAIAAGVDLAAVAAVRLAPRLS
jgi:uncharacterized membrane protein YoaK (UPF0700 family)